HCAVNLQRLQVAAEDKNLAALLAQMVLRSACRDATESILPCHAIAVPRRQKTVGAEEVSQSYLLRINTPQLMQRQLWHNRLGHCRPLPRLVLDWLRLVSALLIRLALYRTPWPRAVGSASCCIARSCCCCCCC